MPKFEMVDEIGWFAARSREPQIEVIHDREAIRNSWDED